MERLLSAPIFFPDGFKDWVSDAFARDIPLIPYTQFLGGRLNIAKSGDYIVTNESRSATAWGDLTTVGPTVSNLADGSYLIIWGCTISSEEGLMGVSINGADPSDDRAVGTAGASAIVSPAYAYIADLKNNNNNTVQCKYRNVVGGGSNFRRRWLAVIRISQA